MIDVAAPVAPKDYAKLGRCLRGVLQSSETPIGNVYLIDHHPRSTSSASPAGEV